MLIINQNFNKSMEVGTEKCLLSRVCPKLTAYECGFRCTRIQIRGVHPLYPLPKKQNGKSHLFLSSSHGTVSSVAS